jgi:putative MATE family efflux protein
MEDATFQSSIESMSTVVANGAPRPALPERDARTLRMLEAPVLPMLVRMATPNALAFVVQASVSMVEAWYIGRLGTVSLAAIALVFPALMLMQMLAGGAIGGAVTSAIARSLGAGDRARAEKLVWHALWLTIAGGAFFFVVYLAFGERLLQALGAEGDVLVQAHAYATVLFAGCTLLWGMALLSAVFRGMGDMRTPAFLMFVGGLVQVLLSGALILGWFGIPSLGIVGGAVSVLVVAGLNTLIQLGLLARGHTLLVLARRTMSFSRALFADILKVGALASLSPVFTVLTIGLLNALMAGFGTSAIAGYGIGARVEFLLIPLVFGLGASMTSMVGVNVGAGNLPRAERIGWTGGAAASALTGVVGIVLALVPELWMDLFTQDPAARDAGVTYLRVVGPVFAFQGLGLSLYFAAQGAGAVFWPVVATLLRFLVAVGGAMLGVELFGFGLGYVCACIAMGMVLYGALTAASVCWGAWRARTR